MAGNRMPFDVTIALTQREGAMTLLNWLLENRENLCRNRNGIGPALPLNDPDDPQWVKLYGRQADAYNVFAGHLPDEIFKQFQEWVAAQEDLERYLAVKLYAKGMIDGMVMLAQWLNGQGREVA